MTSAEMLAEERRMMPHSSRPPKLTPRQIAAVLRCDGQLRSAASLGARLSTMRALWRRGIVAQEIGPGSDGMPLLAHRYALTPHGSWVRAKLEEVQP